MTGNLLNRFRKIVLLPFAKPGWLGFAPGTRQGVHSVRAIVLPTGGAMPLDL